MPCQSAAIEPCAQHRQGGIRRLPARGLAADTIDHDEQTPAGIAVIPIFVAIA
jgi:hypothetical protein